MTTQTFSVGANPSIKIENVAGDLIVTGWDRSEVEARGDEIRQAQSGDTLSFSSAGDLILSMPHGATLALGYIAGDVKLEDINGAIIVSFVGGDAILRNLSGQVSMAGAIGGDVQMENVGKISMGARKSGLNEDLSERIRSRVEEATRRAERKMRDAEEKIRRAEMKMQHAGHRMHGSIPPVPPIPPRPPRPPRFNFSFDRSDMNQSGQVVSDEERMAILKMLQEKKITAEEAEKLLAALEGGS